MIGMNGHFLTTEIQGMPFGTAGQWRSNNVLEFTTYALESVMGARYRLSFTEQGLLAEKDGIPTAMPTAPAVAFKTE